MKEKFGEGRTGTKVNVVADVDKRFPGKHLRFLLEEEAEERN